jgi:hypothetical protein
VSPSGTAAGVAEPAGLPQGVEGAGAFPRTPSLATASHNSTRSECLESKPPWAVYLSGISRKAAPARQAVAYPVDALPGKGIVTVTDPPREDRLGVAAPVRGDRQAADFGCEAVFEVVLATKDPALVQQAFERFHAARRQREEAHALAIRGHVAQVFVRPRLPVPTHSPKLSEHGFNIDIVAAYSADTHIVANGVIPMFHTPLPP